MSDGYSIEPSHTHFRGQASVLDVIYWSVVYLGTSYHTEVGYGYEFAKKLHVPISSCQGMLIVVSQLSVD